MPWIYGKKDAKTIMDRRLDGYKYFLGFNLRKILLYDSQVESQIQEILSKEDRFSVLKISSLKALRKEFPDDSTSYESVALISRRRFGDGNLKTFFQERGYNDVFCYLIVSGIQNPRWFFPCEKGILRKSKNIVRPSKLRSMIIWRIAKLLSDIGLARIIFPAHIWIAHRTNENNSLTQWLQEIFRNISIKIVLYTGAPGPFQKFTAQILDGNYQVLGYVKIGSNLHTIARIENEMNSLTSLGNYDLQNIRLPKIIEKKSPVKDTLMICTTPPPEGFSTVDHAINEVHIQALINLFHYAPQKVLPLQGYMENLLDEFAQVKETSTEMNLIDFEQMLHSFISYLSIKGPNEITLIFSHGDFIPWNIFRKQSQLFIFDWEMADYRVPFWDIYTFILHSNMVKHGKNKEKMWHLLTTEYVTLVGKFNAGIGKVPEINQKLYLSIFFYQTLLIYLKYHQLEKDLNFPHNDEILNIIELAHFCFSRCVSRLVTEA